MIIQSDSEEIDLGAPLDDVISLASESDDPKIDISEKFRTFAQKLILQKLKNFKRKKVQEDGLRKMFRKLYLRKFLTKI